MEGHMDIPEKILVFAVIRIVLRHLAAIGFGKVIQAKHLKIADIVRSRGHAVAAGIDVLEIRRVDNAHIDIAL